MQVALTGDPGQEETKLAVERLVVVFRAHVAEAGGGAAWNAKDRARSEGLRGSRWQGHSSMVSRSYYRGGKERVKRRDADGNEKEIERCRMGLETQLPWESRLPDELTVTADQVTRALEKVADGASRGLLPPHEPHRWVQHDTLLHSDCYRVGTAQERDEHARQEAAKAVWRLPHEATSEEVENTMWEAWARAAGDYVRKMAKTDWSAAETEAAARIGARESLKQAPGRPVDSATQGRRPTPLGIPDWRRGIRIHARDVPAVFQVARVEKRDGAAL